MESKLKAAQLELERDEGALALRVANKALQEAMQGARRGCSVPMHVAS